MKAYTIYKIYYGEELVYIGKTGMQLNQRLRTHFFKTPMVRMIDITQVSKIEHASMSQADMIVMELYLINKCKPIMNAANKARDELSFEIQEPIFELYECELMGKWANKIEDNDRHYAAEKVRKKEREKERLALRVKRREGEITEDEYWDQYEELEQQED